MPRFPSRLWETTSTTTARDRIRRADTSALVSAYGAEA